MPRTYKTVTGPVLLPNGVVPVSGRIIFTLSSWDKQLGEALYVPGPLSVPLDASGNFTCNLFSNNVGENSTVYRVSVIHGTDRETIVETYIATVAIVGTGTIHIANLPMVPEWTPNSPDVLAAALAAQELAETSAEEAQASATAAAISSAQATAAAALAAMSYVPVFASHAALALATVVVDTVLVDGVLYQYNATGIVADSTGKLFGPAWFVTPKMFGAVGNGVADDLLAVRAAWDYSALHKLPCLMEGLSYNCSGSVFTSSNLNVVGGGAVMYITAWPAVGGFVNNVRPAVADRVQTNIRISDLTTDGSKLPAPGPSDNCNLGPEFARGASNVRIVNCTARFIREGFGGGTGGSGFGAELGAQDILFDSCSAHDCFRAIRFAGHPGLWADASAQPKNTINMVVRDFTAKNCGTAVFCHSVGELAGDDTSDLTTFDVLFDGLFIYNCGHAGWTPFDYAAYPSIPAQKSGVITLGGAQNIRFRGVRVRLDNTYTGSTDWLGRTGYPAAATQFIGAGLSGPVGALVWGWGRNIVVEDITLDGSVDVFWKCNRAIAFGDYATVDPTYATGTVAQIVFESIRHVRPGVYNYVFDGQTGLINGDMSAVINVVPTSNPTVGIIGPNGTATLTNVLVRITNNLGETQEGSAVEWLAAGNIRPTGEQRQHSKAGYDFGGGYSATGLRKGQSFDPVAGILRTSQDTAAIAYHQAFYNPSGLVGGIMSTGLYTRLMLSANVWIQPGLGSPEGIVTAVPGCMFLRLDGGAGTTLYVKQTGTGTTGWAAK